LAGDYEQMPGFGSDYFLNKRNDAAFKTKLVENLKNLAG
jgi:hypothetical protein